MNTSDVPPSRVPTAIALSLVAHLCALLLLAALLGDRSIILSSDPEVATTLSITTITLVHRTPNIAVQRRVTAPRQPRPAPALVAQRPPMGAVGTARPTRQVKAVPASEGAARENPHGAVGSRHTLQLVGATSPPRQALAVAAATPVPVPTGTNTPATVVAANFGGLFSQNYPPTLSTPSDLTAIRSLLSGPVYIRVDVDESGQATDVRFVRPLSDPALERAIRVKLLSLHYVPADCNGLHCEGTLEIRN